MSELADYESSELKELLLEKRQGRWAIIFGSLLTDTAADAAKERGEEVRVNAKTLIKLKAYQADQVRQYDEDIALIGEELKERGEDLFSPCPDWHKRYFWPLKGTGIADCLTLTELSEQHHLELAAIAHLIAFCGIQVKFFGEKSEARFDPEDMRFLAKIPAGQIKANGLTPAAWLTIVPVGAGKLKKWLEGDQDWLSWDEALTAKENLT